MLYSIEEEEEKSRSSSLVNAGYHQLKSLLKDNETFKSNNNKAVIAKSSMLLIVGEIIKLEGNTASIYTHKLSLSYMWPV